MLNGRRGISIQHSEFSLQHSLSSGGFEEGGGDPVEGVLGVGGAAVYFEGEGFGAVQLDGDGGGEGAGVEVLLFVDGFVVQLDADGDVGEGGVAFNGIQGAEGGVAGVEVIGEAREGVDGDAVGVLLAFELDGGGGGELAVEVGGGLAGGADEGVVDT